jgi:hypothetical protein
MRRHRRAQVVDDHRVQLPDYDGDVRRLAVRGLGHEHPTILISNDFSSRPKLLIEKYSRRMGIEQRLAEWIRACSTVLRLPWWGGGRLRFQHS